MHICLLSVLGVLQHPLLVSSKLLVAPGLELFTVMLPGAPLAARVRCPPKHVSAHVHFVPKGWQLAQTSLLLRTLSGHTVQEPYCVTVIRTTTLLSLHCSSDQCRRYPDSGPLLLKDGVCRNHPISQCLPLSQSGDGAAWSSLFLKSGGESLGVLEQRTNIIAWKPGICQGEECGRHGNSSPHLTAK